MTETIEIASGEVIEVQLTSETFVAEDGRRAAGRIGNRMRIFIRDADGREEHYDVEGAEIGVRDGHTIAIVQGRVKGAREPLDLMLANFTTDERDVFEAQLYRFLWKKPFFGPLWKAAGLAAIVFLYGIFHSQIVLGHYRTMSITVSAWWALFFAFLSFPVLWWITGMWDKFTQRARYKKMRKAFIDEVEGKLRAYARHAAAA